MLNDSSLTIVIPARYASSRLPGKMLADIHGFPMIYWTYYRASMAGIGRVIVAADDPVVYRALEKYDIPFIETSQSCINGTERVAEVAKKLLGSDFFMNIQGDEPLLNPQTIVDVFKDGLNDGCFKTAVSRADSGSNISEIKVAISSDNRIRFASRGNIPCSRDSSGIFFKIHGVYTFSRVVLEKFNALKPGPLELIESIEQLRCIEYDIPLQAVMTSHTERSVDTFQDLTYMRSKPVSDFLNWKSSDS
jgi:3-deoxy-manno-octulosonate cytidylyltransferase (CMP-KDO synthetase)